MLSDCFCGSCTLSRSTSKDGLGIFSTQSTGKNRKNLPLTSWLPVGEISGGRGGLSRWQIISTEMYVRIRRSNGFDWMAQSRTSSTHRSRPRLRRHDPSSLKRNGRSRPAHRTQNVNPKPSSTKIPHLFRLTVRIDISSVVPTIRAIHIFQKMS